MSNKQTFQFINIMTHYGVSLGFLIGLVGAIPLALMWFDVSNLLPVLAVIVIISMCGGLVGMIYGAISGFMSGVLMTATTRFIFRDIKQETIYRVTMGMLAFGATLLIFVVDSVWLGNHNGNLFSKSMPVADWYAVWVMALVFAVYASQRATTQYLPEIDMCETKRG